MKQADDLKKNGAAETRMEMTDEDLEKVSGGQMMWGRTCKICGGIIGNDPQIPDGLRCTCDPLDRPF